jgi:HTH-type transcriptional regulator/antitoxin HigA
MKIEINTIGTKAEHRAALAELKALMSASPALTRAERAKMEVLALLIETYEEKHFPIPPPDPVEAILFRMDQQGLTRADLVPLMGSKSKVSEVLARKRPLSLTMIRALHRALGIPAQVLMAEYAVPAPA